MPSLEVITRLPLPLLATQAYRRSSGDQQIACQLLSAAERTLDQSRPVIPSTGGGLRKSVSAAADNW